MLVHLLRSHPDVRCVGEIMGDREKPRRADLARLRQEDPIRFLSDWVYASPVAGFKIKYEELSRPNFSEIRDWLVAERSINLVHLFRRNRLKRFASQAAVRRHKGYNFTGRRPEPSRFALSLEECLADFRKQERREARFRRLFAEHRVLEVTYEDLSLDRVQRFLGVEARELQTPTLKVNPERVSDMVTNYAELREAFRGTAYEAYLDDAVYST